jgi:hypothetical protein
MPKNDNLITAALRLVFGPLVKQSTKWPPVLAYGLPGIVAVMLLALLRTAVQPNLLWLLGTVVLAPLIGYIVSDFLARRDHNIEKRSYQATGTIESPISNQIVGREIECVGSAINIPKDMHLWLAVEASGLIWPKEGEVLVDNGGWKKKIYEEGASKTFSISLWIANQNADAQIRE